MSYPMNCRTNQTEVAGYAIPPPKTNASDIWPWRIGLFGLGGTSIACVGVLSNIITIIVLAHYKTSSTAPFLLMTLAVWDTTFLVSELFLECLTYLAQGGVISDSYRDFIRPLYCFLFPVPQLTRTVSAYIIVLITLERYIVVAWPLTAHTLLRPKLARVVVLGVVCVILLYHIPLYMAYTCSKIYNNTTHTHTTQFHRTSVGRSEWYTQLYHTWFHLMVYFVLPFFVLSVTNVLLLRALKKAKKESSIAANLQQRRVHREMRLSLMVLTMTGLFFLCYLFPAVSFILTTGLNQYNQCSIHCNRFSAIADTVIMLNSAINLGIYCASGKKFREVCNEVFCSKALFRTGVRSRPGMVYTTTTTTTTTSNCSRKSTRHDNTNSNICHSSKFTPRETTGESEKLALLLCCSTRSIKVLHGTGSRFTSRSETTCSTVMTPDRSETTCSTSIQSH